MANFQDWVNSVVGKPIDVDGVYGDQCVDVAESYCKFLWPGNNWPQELGFGNAKDLFNNSNPNYFRKINYSPGLAPQQGDMVIYGATASNPYGHIAVVESATPSDIVVVEQNGFNPSGNAYVTHRTYANMIGFIRPIGVDIGDTDMVQPSEADVYSAFSQFSHEGKPANPDQVKYYMARDIRDLYHDLLFFEILPKDPEIIDAFKQFQPWTPLNAPPYQDQSAYYASHPSGFMYKDLATGLKKKLDAAPAPSTSGGLTTDQATSLNRIDTSVQWLVNTIKSIFNRS